MAISFHLGLYYFLVLNLPHLFCSFPPSLSWCGKHSSLSEPRHRRWEQQETRPSSPHQTLTHSQRKRESEGTRERPSVEAPEEPWGRPVSGKSKVLPTHAGTSYSSSTHPQPCRNFLRLSLSLRWEAAAVFLYFFYCAHTASQADWGNIKAEAWAKPRNALLSQCGKLCKAFFLNASCVIVN